MAEPAISFDHLKCRIVKTDAKLRTLQEAYQMQTGESYHSLEKSPMIRLINRRKTGEVVKSFLLSAATCTMLGVMYWALIITIAEG